VLPSYDIVVLQRKLFQWWILWLIRKRSAVFIYDFDDAVLFRDSNSANFHSRSRLGRFKSTLKSADVVIAGNEYLRELSSPFARRISVIPTGIDIQKYSQKPRLDAQASLTIGWIGTQSNLIYLKQLIDPINEVYRGARNFKFKIVCDGFIEGFVCPLEKKMWTDEEEVSDIHSFDIGLLPLLDDRWTRGKCALKLLQYMSCGVASVSTHTEVTSKIVQDGRNGFLASSDSQWVEKIKFLLENSNERQFMGIKGRESLHGSYDVETIALKYARVFNEAVRSKKTTPVRADK
jgi:glycosyltransferase involved in cell wall biosynthesis